MSQSPHPSDPAAVDEGVLAEARAEASVPSSASRADAGVEADHAGPTPAAAPVGSLWRDRNFLTMWSGQTLSQFGAQVTELAVPVLAVLLLNATEWQVGVLNAANVAAFLLVGLPAGAWIDRMRKRHVMIAADLVRAAALALVPLLWMLGMLQMWHLVAIMAVVGIATVFFDVSYQSIVPSLVRPNQIAEANGKLQSSYELANIAGPGFGGWLVGLITAPLAVLATAGTYVVSAVALLFTRDHEPPRAIEDRGPILREIWEGLHFVFTEKLLRRIVGTTGTSNFFSTVSGTLLPLFLLRDLGFTPVSLGLIFSLGAVGGLLGAMATPHIVRWIGEARAIPVSALGFSIIGLVVPLAAAVPAIAFPLLVAQAFVMSFTVLLYNITQVTFRQRITPMRLLGRMNASVRFVVWGVMPIAALLAGLLGTWLGVLPTMWIGAIGQLLSAAFVVFGPFWAMRELPDVHTSAASADETPPEK
ncbi:MFS transporter [Microbacterium sp. CFBP9034]|uniref:MFS transporter n=1 Tax=Microbacterium sp. CFBP9034 TaxID=3096540 RepID=UPI002A6B31FE|nr:MFS transporter [Microbacterium sp. CFBP9034]MDY0908268.1 MFS transporter [Microbacterium sp. CFBP9034]